MENHELEDEIDELALRIERKIAEGERFLEELPEFAPRSAESRKMERAFN